MSLAQYIWDAVIDLVETIGAYEDHDTLEAKNTEPNPTDFFPFANLRPKFEHSKPTDIERAEAAASIETQHSNVIHDPESKDATTEEVLTSEDSDQESDNDTDLEDLNDGLQQEISNVLIEKIHPEDHTHLDDQDLSAQNQTLQQENLCHLKWQDRASMAIKKMKEEAGARKHKARTTMKAAVRARIAMQRQIEIYERQIEESEQDRDRVFDENARAAEALEKTHKRRLQRARNELETQKEAAEEAAVTAERRITEGQAKHNEDMSEANAKVKDLQAAQTFILDCKREANGLRDQLAQAKREKTEQLAAKEEEIERLQICVNNRDCDIRRLKDDAVDERRATMDAISKKGRLERAKLAADGELEKLKTENASLNSERGEVESRALGAEGRAKGLQDQLMVTKRRAEHWETLYNKTEENARNEVLGAYDVATVQIPEEDQQTPTTSSEEEGLSVLVEKLRKENDDLQKKHGGLIAEIEKWNQAWEKAEKEQKAWQQETRRQYDAEKQKALAEERANDRANQGQDSREHDIRRQCEEEKQKALAAEREKCRVQWEIQESLLKGQFAVKFKSHTKHELQKLRHRAGVEHKKQLKVRKSQAKWVFGQAVSRAVQVERSLLQNQLRKHFQAELSNYKTQFESEHACSQTQSEARNDTGSTNQVLLDEEIKKREGYIILQKTHLKKAFEAKRESENALKSVREENQRLSREVMAFESQTAMAKQAKNKRQITLMTQELARALKLFSEIAILGLDEKHRQCLNELVLANKVLRDIRSTIEGGAFIDYKEFRDRLGRIVDGSDEFETLDPRERPALHAQLSGTYSIVGSLINILAGGQGDTTNEDILERIYRDHVKGKEKQGATIGSGAASGSSFGVNGGISVPALPQPNGNNSFTSGPKENFQATFGNPSISQGTRNPSAEPFTTPPKPKGPKPQDEPKYIDSATAHALQENHETNQGMFDLLDVAAIDWSDAVSQAMS